MRLHHLTPAGAAFERSPEQEADIFVANGVDGRHGSPISVGYGRYAPHQRLDEVMAVDDVMVVIEGRLSVTADGLTVSAGPGEIVHMAKGTQVTIRSHEDGALTAYVTYPHWEEARR